MKILALDIGKYKSVGCDYEAETGRHSFATVATTPQALHDLMMESEPDRVVIETMAGFDCLSATVGAAADEDQESPSRSVAARRSDLAAGTESVDANRDGRLAGVGQATLRELAERAVAWRVGS